MPRNRLAICDWAKIGNEVIEACAEHIALNGPLGYLQAISQRYSHEGVTAGRLGNWLKLTAPGWHKRKDDAMRAWAERRPLPAPPPIPQRQELKDEFAEILDVPVRPFQVPVPKLPAIHRGKWKHTTVHGDSHFPFQDDAAIKVVLGIIKDVQPDTIVHDGDLLDCYSISRFSIDPQRKNTLQDDIDAGRIHLHQISQIAPSARKILLEGNHEDRLRKLVWSLEGAQRQLAMLRVFQQAVTWPNLLDLESIGWEHVPYRKQPFIGALPKLLLKHGEVARKWSGWTAKAEWEKHAKGGISGHTHRLGAFYHRDLNGSHVWLEAGCTCRLDPEYVNHPDWQQGMVVIAHNEDRFNAELVYIQDGKAMWRSAELAA